MFMMKKRTILFLMFGTVNLFAPPKQLDAKAARTDSCAACAASDGEGILRLDLRCYAGHFDYSLQNAARADESSKAVKNVEASSPIANSVSTVLPSDTQHTFNHIERFYQLQEQIQTRIAEAKKTACPKNLDKMSEYHAIAPSLMPAENRTKTFRDCITHIPLILDIAEGLIALGEHNHSFDILNELTDFIGSDMSVLNDAQRLKITSMLLEIADLSPQLRVLSTQKAKVFFDMIQQLQPIPGARRLGIAESFLKKGDQETAIKICFNVIEVCHKYQKKLEAVSMLLKMGEPNMLIRMMTFDSEKPEADLPKLLRINKAFGLADKLFSLRNLRAQSLIPPFHSANTHRSA